jgi:hypothetical protein
MMTLNKKHRHQLMRYLKKISLVMFFVDMVQGAATSSDYSAIGDQLCVSLVVLGAAE